MTKAAPPHKLLTDLTLAEWTSSMFELLSLPSVARGLKKVADEDGTTVDVISHGIFADLCHKHGVPLPPDLRQYLMTQPMPDAVRERYLKPHLN
jgi:hypothetical protein